MPSGVVDYWCNAFTPDRADVWHASLAAQGVALRLAGERDGFADAEAMIERMDTGIGQILTTLDKVLKNNAVITVQGVGQVALRRVLNYPLSRRDLSHHRIL